MNILKITKLFEEIGLTIKISQVEQKLPLIYGKHYDWCQIDVLNKDQSLLIIEERREGKLDSFLKQAQIFKERFNMEPILCFKKIAPESKKVLISRGISFMDYEGNLFLPTISLRNVPIQKEFTSDKPFTKSEQLILIDLLLQSEKRFSYKDLIEMTSFSQATIYRTLKEFTKMGWLQSMKEDFILKKDKVQIFEEAKQRFFDPIKRKIYIEPPVMEAFKSMQPKIKSAGEMALSEYAFLSANQPCYAISEKNFLTMGDSIDSFDVYLEGLEELQLWKYESITDANMVDPLSLYLSFEKQEDPRLDQALEDMLYKSLGKS